MCFCRRRVDKDCVNWLSELRNSACRLEKRVLGIREPRVMVRLGKRESEEKEEIFLKANIKLVFKIKERYSLSSMKIKPSEFVRFFQKK